MDTHRWAFLPGIVQFCIFCYAIVVFTTTYGIRWTENFNDHNCPREKIVSFVHSYFIQAYGPAKHEDSKELIEKAYPGYSVSISYDGYWLYIV